MSLSNCRERHSLRKQPTFPDATSRFPTKIESEEREQKFHTDDVSPARSGFSLVEANFTRGSTNQKHRPDLGCDTSSVWNFMGSFLKRHFAGNQRWRRLMSVELTLIF